MTLEVGNFKSIARMAKGKIFIISFLLTLMVGKGTTYMAILKSRTNISQRCWKELVPLIEHE